MEGRRCIIGHQAISAQVVPFTQFQSATSGSGCLTWLVPFSFFPNSSNSSGLLNLVAASPPSFAWSRWLVTQEVMKGR